MGNEFDVNELYNALDHQRQTRGLTWAGVAKEIEALFAKVSASTVSGIRDKQIVEGDGVLQMLLWLERSPESFVPGFKTSTIHELVVAENAVLRFDVKEIYRKIDEKRMEAGLSWAEVAEQIGGFSIPSLRRFASGGRTSFPGVMRIAFWLEVPVKELTREGTW